MSRPTFWRQAIEIARKDLRTEARSGEVLLVTVPFAAVALLLIPLAVGTEIRLLRLIGPGMYWTVVLLFGMLVTFRQTAQEGPAQRDLLALLGVDPAARFVGQALATGILLLAFEALLAPVVLVLYDPPLPPGPWPLVVVPLVAAGLALLGTLAGAITAGVRTRTALAPLLMAPLAAPLLLAATESLSGLAPPRSILSWALLLVAADLLLALAGVAGARPLEEGFR